MALPSEVTVGTFTALVVTGEAWFPLASIAGSRGNSNRAPVARNDPRRATVLAKVEPSSNDGPANKGMQRTGAKGPRGLRPLGHN